MDLRMILSLFVGRVKSRTVILAENDLKDSNDNKDLKEELFRPLLSLESLVSLRSLRSLRGCFFCRRLVGKTVAY